MKRILPVIILLVTCFSVYAEDLPNAWINELHYDNESTDANEMVEIIIQNAGDYSLSDFSVTLYNGNNGASYGDKSVSDFSAGDVQGDYSIFYVVYPANGLQNGAPDGLALSYQGNLIQFLSYEGSFDGADGVASGVTSTDIGVEEGGGTPADHSLQLTGGGGAYADFTWAEPGTATAGTLNTGQTVGGDVEPTPAITVSVSSLSNFAYDFEEGPSTAQSFTVSGANLSGDVTVAAPESNWEISADGTSFQTSAITLTATDGVVAETTIYVRLVAGLSVGEYDGVLSLTATDATEKTIDLAGSVDGPADLSLPFTEDFATDMGEFTAFSAAGEQAWKWATYDDGCVTMSGYDGTNNIENTDWLVSPTFDFSTNSNIRLTYSEAINYITSISDLTVLVSTDYEGDVATANWNTLDVTGRSEGASWTFVTTNAIDLSAYAGEQAVTIAFKFVSSTEGSSTWEVGSFSLFEAEPIATTPTNNVTNFTATTGSVTETTIDLAWDENDGEVVPDGYLIAASTEAIVAPEDGTLPEDDTDLTDGGGNVVVAHGTTSYSFDNCSSGTTYNFSIFPYILIDGAPLYKTVDAPVVVAKTEQAGQDTVFVETLAELRAGETDGTLYCFSGDAAVTFVQSFRNQKFIQDNTAAIMLDDDAGNIETTFEAGNGISNITGTLTDYYGMLEFTPAGDAEKTETAAVSITPQVVSVADFEANFEDYEAELVKFEAVTFEESGEFATGTDYSIKDEDNNSTVLYTDFYNADYIGQSLLTDYFEVTGIAFWHSDAATIVPRTSADMGTITGVNDFAYNAKIYSRGHEIVINTNVTGGSEAVIYSIYGQKLQAKTSKSPEFTMTVTHGGVYLVSVTHDGQTKTAKIIVY